MTKLVFCLLVSLTLLHCLVSPQQTQTRLSLSNEGFRFTPRNPAEQPLSNMSTSSRLLCAHRCVADIDCRVLVYDPVTLFCTLYRSDLLFGNITVSPSPSKSRVGVVQYDELVSYYNQTCEYCRLNRYLICQSGRCRCSLPKTFWNGAACQMRRVQSETCSSSVPCRQDLNLTCVFGVCNNDTSGKLRAQVTE